MRVSSELIDDLVNKLKLIFLRDLSYGVVSEL